MKYKNIQEELKSPVRLSVRRMDHRKMVEVIGS